MLSQMTPQMPQWSQGGIDNMGVAACQNMVSEWLGGRGNSSGGMARRVGKDVHCGGNVGYGGAVWI